MSYSASWMARSPAACLRALDLLGALEKILPELSGLKGVEQRPPHVHDVWEHTLSVVNHLEQLISVALTPEYDPEKSDDLFNGLLVLRTGPLPPAIERKSDPTLTADRPLRGLLFLAALYHDVAKPPASRWTKTASSVSGATTCRELKWLLHVPAAWRSKQ